MGHPVSAVLAGLFLVCAAFAAWLVRRLTADRAALLDEIGRRDRAQQEWASAYARLTADFNELSGVAEADFEEWSREVAG